jgi:hypothetical protein
MTIFEWLFLGAAIAVVLVCIWVLLLGGHIAALRHPL